MKNLSKYQEIMTRNLLNRTTNLLNFSYYQNYCKLIGIDLPIQTNTNIPQQINFTGKLEEDAATMLFCC